jgi:hypothetical protein
MDEGGRSISTTTTYPILFRFRSLPSYNSASIHLTSPGLSAVFSLGDGAEGATGFSISLPSSNDQLQILALTLTGKSLNFTPAISIGMVDISLYVTLAQPVFRGYVALPRGSDVMIVTPWDRLDVIGNSMWTASCVDPEAPGMFMGRLAGASFNRPAAEIGHRAGPLPPPAAQADSEAAALAPTTKERTKS